MSSILWGCQEELNVPHKVDFVDFEKQNVLSFLFGTFKNSLISPSNYSMGSNTRIVAMTMVLIPIEIGKACLFSKIGMVYL